MRFKYYLRGIGIAITLATLLLTVSFYFGRDYLYNQKLSDEEIIQKASALGMVMPENENQEEVYEEEVSDEEISDIEEVKETEEIAANSSTEDEEVPKSAELTESTEPTEAADLSDANTNEETVKYIAFTVRAGESSEVICSNLKKAGLIEDAEEFNKYLHKCDVDHRIQNGTFYVKQDSEYDDLIAVLVNKDVRTTTPPKN